MATLSEIIDIFSRLAIQLQSADYIEPHYEEERTEARAKHDTDLSISKLNQYLNLDENPRVTVLDAALSLMGFRAPQVFNSMTECMVATIRNILSASISCKVTVFSNEEVLTVGSLIPAQDCWKLINACADVVDKLKGHGLLFHHLAYSVIRVAVSAPCCQYLLSSRPTICVTSIRAECSSISKLLKECLLEESLLTNKIPPRVLVWHLDPLILKSDVCKMLQETMQRPFLCLSKEFQERGEWRCITISWVLSPHMFVETRLLLHNWFLVTGLSFVLQLLVEIVSVIMDVLSGPTMWGITAELGLKVPFSSAYFPHNAHFLRILAGPLTYENLLQLVHATSKPLPNDGYPADPHPEAIKISMINHKSLWALAINFPDWFLFSSAVLFCDPNVERGLYSIHRQILLKTGEEYVEKCSASAAARYIAWILSPCSKSCQDLLFDLFIRLSGSLSCKQVFSTTLDGQPTTIHQKLKKPKFVDNGDRPLVRNCEMIRLLLQELNNIYARWNKNSSLYMTVETNYFNRNVWFRKIPLGLLLGCSDNVNIDGCDLLLHYAATGRISQSRKINISGSSYENWTKEIKDSIYIDQCSREDAVAGACLVFNYADAVERMSASLSETEGGGNELIYWKKVQTGNYLMTCIKRLIKLRFLEGSTLVDLHSRLLRWRHQGKDVMHVLMDLDPIINDLHHEILERQRSLS